jgi:hypothetical protein
MDAQWGLHDMRPVHQKSGTKLWQEVCLLWKAW